MGKEVVTKGFDFENWPEENKENGVLPEAWFLYTKEGKTLDQAKKETENKFKTR